MQTTDFYRFAVFPKPRKTTTRTNKILQYLAALVLCASLIDLVIAGIYDNRIRRAPVFDPRPANGELFLYSPFLPMFSLCLCLFLLTTHTCYNHPSPRASIPIAALSLIGYITIACVWASCEVTGEDGAARWCPQYGLGGTGVGKESNVARVGHSAGLAKMGVGWVCVVAWGAYLGIAVYGVLTAKKQLGGYVPTGTLNA